jgi:hypothetical protein
MYSVAWCASQLTRPCYRFLTAYTVHEAWHVSISQLVLIFVSVLWSTVPALLAQHPTASGNGHDDSLLPTTCNCHRTLPYSTTYTAHALHQYKRVSIYHFTAHLSNFLCRQYTQGDDKTAVPAACKETSASAIYDMSVV